MQDEPASPACLAARAKFGRALEDPAVEEEILHHARGCLACMDAYLELQDTVKRLQNASEAIPDTGTFSTRVFEAIERETRRRASRRFRTLGLILAAFLLGAGAAAVAFVLAPQWLASPSSGDAAGAGVLGTGALEEGEEGPGAGNTPREASPGPGSKAPETGEENGPHEAEKEIVKDLFEDFRAIEKGAGHAPGVPGRGRGWRLYRTRNLLERARRLSPWALSRLIEKLEKTAPDVKDFSEMRMRKETMGRLKAFQDKTLRPGKRVPPPQKGEK